MKCDLTINIKDAKTGNKLYTLVENEEVPAGIETTKQHALDLIQNHLHCYIRAFEIYPVKSNTTFRQCFGVKPNKQHKHASIIINVKWL